MKRLIINCSETNIVVYCIVRRETDKYLLDDSNGSFATNPADPYLTLTEDSVIKGHYEVNEGRTVWTDGLYTISFYKRVDGNPNPANDIQIGAGEMFVKNDTEVVLNSNLNNLDTYINTNLDAKVSSRSSQVSVDEKASQISVNDLNTYVNNNLDTTVSSRASETSLSAKASQASVDGLNTYVNLNLDTTVSSRASEVNLNEKASNLDGDILSRASQASLDGQASNINENILTRASQLSLDEQVSNIQNSISDQTTQLTATFLSAITTIVIPDVGEIRYYNIDKISVFRGDAAQIFFGIRDKTGNQYVLNPERTYLFAVKKNLNDTTYTIEPKVISIANNYLVLNLTKEETITPSGYFYGIFEIMEAENYGTADEKQHTIFQGPFEIKKDVIL